MACLGASVCSPRCVYYSCPCEAAAEGAWVLYTEEISLPSAGSPRSAAATAADVLPRSSTLPPPPTEGFPPPNFTVCVSEVPGLKGSHLPFIPLLKLGIGSGTLVKFEVAFFAPGVTWSKIKIHTQKQALILSDDKHSWG